MKNYSYARRGQTFEDYINLANIVYRSAEVAVIVKQPTPFKPIRDRKGKVVSCKVEEKATVDYLGRYHQLPVAIEAKNTNTDRIRFDAVQPHQAEFMNDFVGEYGLGFSAVLVSFKMERFFLVPWQFWSTARDLWNDINTKGQKATVDAYGMRWTTTGKASVSAEELLPEWEVKISSKYGLDYVNNIHEYITPNHLKYSAI